MNESWDSRTFETKLRRAANRLQIPISGNGSRGLVESSSTVKNAYLKSVLGVPLAANARSRFTQFRSKTEDIPPAFMEMDTY